MIKPCLPANEAKRLKALKELKIIDTVPEKEFDDISELASYVSNSPIALITFIEEERQWFKSRIGIDMCESSRDLSFCGHAILKPQDITIIEDARLDERFKGNPLTQSKDAPIIFYAGVPLTDKYGNALGTLCIIDHEPKKLNEHQIKALKTLAQQVVKLLELRVRNDYLEETEKTLRERNELLKNFAGVVSHDMKMPLANMIVTSDLLKEKYSAHLDEKAHEYLKYLKQSSLTLSDYITKILAHYETDKLSPREEEDQFDIHHLLEEIVDLLNITEDCEINFPENNLDLICNRVALEQILLNLLSNSLKYNDKEKILIDISCEEQKDVYYFTVNDNGMGIPQDKQKDIFELFATIDQIDRNGNRGNGIGLSTVQKLVNSLGGEIQVKSIIGKSTSFTFSIEKPIQQKTA